IRRPLRRSASRRKRWLLVRLQRVADGGSIGDDPRRAELAAQTVERHTQNVRLVGVFRPPDGGEQGPVGKDTIGAARELDQETILGWRQAKLLAEALDASFRERNVQRTDMQV